VTNLESEQCDTVYRGTSSLAQESLSNKTAGTAAQNLEDPFSLGYPHASVILSPQDSIHKVLWFVRQ